MTKSFIIMIRMEKYSLLALIWYQTCSVLTMLKICWSCPLYRGIALYFYRKKNQPVEPAIAFHFYFSNK